MDMEKAKRFAESSTSYLQWELLQHNCTAMQNNMKIFFLLDCMWIHNTILSYWFYLDRINKSFYRGRPFPLPTIKKQKVSPFPLSSNYLRYTNKSNPSPQT
jgi:hypothetical protein